MIFPRGPLHLIGHAQLIPCVDPEHEALLISRLALRACVRSACGMGGEPPRAQWQQQQQQHGGTGQRGKVK